MDAGIRTHRAAVVLLAAALVATLTVALTGGQRAAAVDGPVEVVYVATGQNFPDALAGANLAATVGAPMLTVNTDLPLPEATVTALQALDPNQIIILGGPVAVSDAVKGALGDYTRSGAVTRIEGGDRHDTAAQIADALPSKVHDADLLDGLDSSDFTRPRDLPALFGHAPVSGRIQAASGLLASDEALTYTIEVPVAGHLVLTTSATFSNQNGEVMRAEMQTLVDGVGVPGTFADESLLDDANDANKGAFAATSTHAIEPGTHEVSVVVRSVGKSGLYNGPHDLFYTVTSTAVFMTGGVITAGD